MRAPLLVAATGLALIAPAAPASAETTASVSNGTLDIVGDNASDSIVVGPVSGSNPVVTVRNVDTGGALSVKPHVH